MWCFCVIICFLFWYLFDVYYSVVKNVFEKIYYLVINVCCLINKLLVIWINIRVNIFVVFCVGLYIGDFCFLIIFVYGLIKFGFFDLFYFDVIRLVCVFVIYCVVDGKSFVVVVVSL